jgi:2-dehydropantoate 2-reductase
VLARAGEGSADARAEIDRILADLGRNRSDEQRPSMAQDIFKGRRTETDYINGFVAERGREIGVNAETHAAVNELVRKVERGQIKPGVEHVAGL